MCDKISAIKNYDPKKTSSVEATTALSPVVYIPEVICDPGGIYGQAFMNRLFD